MDWESLAVVLIVLAAIVGLGWRALIRRRRRLTHKACADCTACSSGSCTTCEVQPLREKDGRKRT